MLLQKYSQTNSDRKMYRPAHIFSVADMDHHNSDCVVIVVLSHGEPGRLEARDGTYDVKDIWEPLLECRSLVGKPKLFFIQVS